MRYNARIFAAGVGGLCGPVNVDFETRYATQIVPASASDSCTGEPVSLDPGLVDLELVTIEARSEVVDFCIIEDRIENGLNAALATSVPAQFGAFLDQVRLFENSTLGLPRQPCECDSECQSGLSPRARCVENEETGDRFCHFAAELDRIFMMPEGFVLVFAEDTTDFQHLFLRSPEFELAVFNGLAAGLPPDIARMFGLDYSCRASRLPEVPPSVVDPVPFRVLPVWDTPSL